MAMVLHMFRSGSSGNCALLSVGGTRLLIDAGIGPRVLVKELNYRGVALSDLDGVLYTHCHSDHLRGNTLALLGRAGVPVYLNQQTWEMACQREGKTFIGALSPQNVRLFDPGRPFTLQDLQIDSFRISHGQPGPLNPAGDPVGFVMNDGQDTFGYCTDAGHVTPEMLNALSQADLLVLESNHDVEMERMSPRHWPVKQWILGDTGHLNNVQAATALKTLFAGRERAGVILAHLSELCNTVGMARETTRDALNDLCEIQVGVANRLAASTPWVLERGLAQPMPNFNAPVEQFLLPWG
jgi:phosphoribosyl 1,2-cyclic phosphodiesterase